ncbi:hypothetical protein MILUP08_42728 [Micromonospora lupini str. Lupac 08]|uniref:Uncharacterized protein n=1 Tax=Micromonospora lupini str. Lupac 08 TaxID=1150864 RepID=I0L1V0_9ACTN|nr:hypothetical protein MILUP08_42728 [Micromonospora lupini str. Lupac 08]
MSGKSIRHDSLAAEPEPVRKAARLRRNTRDYRPRERSGQDDLCVVSGPTREEGLAIAHVLARVRLAGPGVGDNGIPVSPAWISTTDRCGGRPRRSPWSWHQNLMPSLRPAPFARQSASTSCAWSGKRCTGWSPVRATGAGRPSCGGRQTTARPT